MKFSLFPNGLQLRLPSLAAMCFLVVATVVLAYVAGIMRGRTYFGSDRAMSATARHTPAGTAALGAGDDNNADARRILAPEELKFASVLRNDSVAFARQRQIKNQPAKLATPPQPAAVSPETSTAASPTPLASGEPDASKPSALFDYVFQVAAFRDEADVDNLRRRLEGQGLRTRMQKEGKMLVVLVALRADEQRAAAVLRLMEELRLGAPVTRSRNPVPNERKMQ